jgi:hypothetical protein
MKLILILAVLTLLIGCQDFAKSARPTPSPINPNLLLGSWELASLSADDVTLPAKPTTGASEAGYKESFEKIQYQITADKFHVIVSDELAVTMDDEKTYQISGSKIVPNNSAADAITGIEVLSLTPGTMIARSTGKSDLASLLMHFVRINEADLATNKLKPVPQQISYALKTPTLDVSESAAAALLESTTNLMVTCTYSAKKAPRLRISALTMRRSAGSVSIDGRDPNVTLEVDAQFDFSKPTETLLVKAQSVRGTYNKNAIFALFDATTCDVTIKRNKRMLNVTSQCPGANVSVGNGVASTGDVSLTADCATVF